MTRILHRRLIRLRNNSALILGGLLIIAGSAVVVDRLASLGMRLAGPAAKVLL